MKKILLGLLFGIFMASSSHAATWSTESIHPYLWVDAIQHNLTSTTYAACGLASASAVSGTVVLIPAVVTAAIETLFRVPNDYWKNGRFIMVGQNVLADETAAQFQIDVQSQYPSSLTTTTITNGTACAALGAAAGSQVTETELANAHVFYPNRQCHLYLARTAGTTRGYELRDVYFKYEAKRSVPR